MVSYGQLPEKAGPFFLYCRKCRNRYSATKGDYFSHDPLEVAMCCDESSALAREIVDIQIQTVTRDGWIVPMRKGGRS